MQLCNEDRNLQINKRQVTSLGITHYPILNLMTGGVGDVSI